MYFLFLIHLLFIWFIQKTFPQKIFVLFTPGRNIFLLYLHCPAELSFPYPVYILLQSMKQNWSKMQLLQLWFISWTCWLHLAFSESLLFYWAVSCPCLHVCVLCKDVPWPGTTFLVLPEPVFPMGGQPASLFHFFFSELSVFMLLCLICLGVATWSTRRSPCL